MELNKEQTDIANELLGRLCKSNALDNTQVASFFDNDEEAIFVCKCLKANDLLKITLADGNRIAGIDKNDNTCNAFETDFLMKKFIRHERLEISEKNIEKPIEPKLSNFIIKIKEIHKTTIWIIGGIIFLLTAIGLILDNLDRLTKYLKEKESNIEHLSI